MNKQEENGLKRVIRISVVCLIVGVMALVAFQTTKSFGVTLYNGPIREAFCLFNGPAIWQSMNTLGC